MDGYTIRLHPTKEGGYWVTCDEVPGTVTEGSDVGDALVMMAAAMALKLEEDDEWSDANIAKWEERDKLENHDPKFAQWFHWQTGQTEG